ncbi:hypothetical protein [Erwinia amylovora]|uniref:hypothetical protein n=1 Tax=Erwinia amylovora TaxID=552 RepID=UPI001444182E|nr:hypothetical protein [Erwinia amylovora]
MASALAWLFIIPEVWFKHLSESHYHFFADLTNSFNLFGLPANSLTVYLITLPLLLAWLTVRLCKKISLKLMSFDSPVRKQFISRYSLAAPSHDLWQANRRLT